MGKYDFGYELQEGTTNYWAYEIIEKGSKVLELGSSVGMLTKNLKEKNCTVDIVEIDNESGQKASIFARKSCLGDVDGDIENDIWKDKIAGERYDYIVILDVLEHLHNPQKILKTLKLFLADSGKIILSVPNIAHNSVLINLLNNKFEYTSVGLLDDTHIHFFTFDSLKEMTKKCGYSCIKQECIQKAVGDNEIPNCYSDIPPRIASYLKMREGAEIYQFLLVLANGKQEIEEQEMNLVPINKRCSPYRFEVYNGDKMFFSYPIDKNRIDVCIPLNGEQGLFRIDPINAKCILNEIELIGLTGNVKKNLSFENSNAIFLQHSAVFKDDDPQFFVKIDDEKYDSMIFKADILFLDDPLIEKFISNINYKILKKINVSNDFMQVFYSPNKDEYIEKNCICTGLFNEQIIDKKFDLKNEKIRHIRIDPMNISVKIKIIDIIIKCINEEPQKIFKYKTNADRIEGDVYTFFHNDPQLIIDIGTCKQIEYLKFRADILEADIDFIPKQVHFGFNGFLQRLFGRNEKHV